MDTGERDRLALALAPLATARQEAAKALDEATAAMRPAVVEALRQGAPELWLHKMTGVSRSTIRVWKADDAQANTASTS